MQLKHLQTSRKAGTDDRDRLKKSLARAENELRRLVGRSGTVSDEVWQLMQDSIASKESELSHLRALQNEAELQVTRSRFSKADFQTLSRSLPSHLEHATFDEQIRVLSALNVNVGWDGTKAKLQFWPYPFSAYCKDGHNDIDNKAHIVSFDIVINHTKKVKTAKK